jgi:tetratricopeptide (TPR) repeat protein
MCSSKYLLALFTLVLFTAVACKNEKAPVQKETPVDSTNTADNAIQLLDEQIKLKPNDPELLHNRALAYISRKRYQDALTDMRAVIALDSSKSAYFLTMADLAFAANRTFDAKQHLEKALSLDPENTDAMMRLAELNLIVRQYAQSVSLLNKVLAKDKSNTSAWLMRGLNYKENGDTNKAVGDFRSAIEADPNFYDAYMQLGMIFQLRNNPISEGYFANAIRIRPKSEEALYGRGLWFQEHNQLDKAIQDYTSILQFNPSYKTAHFNLGYIHHIYLKVYQEAIKHYGRAIEADPKYAEAYYNRGLCFEFLGNLQDAASDFKTALMIRPVYPPAEEGLKRVSR